MMRIALLSLVVMGSVVGCKTRSNNERKPIEPITDNPAPAPQEEVKQEEQPAPAENTLLQPEPPAATIEETTNVVTDGTGGTVTVDEVIGTNTNSPGAPTLPPLTTDPVTPPTDGVTDVPGNPDAPPVFVNDCKTNTKSKYCVFGPHAAETVYKSDLGKVHVFEGFNNENLGSSHKICLRSIAQAAGRYVKANPEVLNQFRDRNVSVWSMVRLYDYTADSKVGSVSPGIFFIGAGADGKGAATGKWVIRGSVDKNRKCLVPTDAKLAADFKFWAGRIK